MDHKIMEPRAMQQVPYSTSNAIATQSTSNSTNPSTSSSVTSSSLLNDGEHIFEKDLKVDKKILAIMSLGGNDYHPPLNQFLSKITMENNVQIDVSTSLRDRQGNEIPVLKVKALDQKSLEVASALVMEHLDPHRDKMTFNIDVPYNDHSYIIGKDGTRIKQLSRLTGCHIHLPDCNKTSNKKSNKLSIAGTDFTAIDKARDQIRKSLPLNIGFKAQIKSGKFVIIDTASAEVQNVKRKYRVDVTFTNVVANTKYPEVTINVKGGRSQMEEIKAATQELYHFVTEEKLTNNSDVMFCITIDVSHTHHQYVKGKNNCNLKVINQRSGANIIFPPHDSSNNLVIIQGKNILSTVMGWQELMGYLPLLLSFDVNFDINHHYSKLQRLEKEFGVGIRTREKLSGHVYTVLIKTQERHSSYLQEIRHRILSYKLQGAINENHNYQMLNRNHDKSFSNLTSTGMLPVVTNNNNNNNLAYNHKNNSPLNLANYRNFAQLLQPVIENFNNNFIKPTAITSMQHNSMKVNQHQCSNVNLAENNCPNLYANPFYQNNRLNSFAYLSNIGDHLQSTSTNSTKTIPDSFNNTQCCSTLLNESSQPKQQHTSYNPFNFRETNFDFSSITTTSNNVNKLLNLTNNICGTTIKNNNDSLPSSSTTTTTSTTSSKWPISDNIYNLTGNANTCTCSSDCHLFYPFSQTTPCSKCHQDLPDHTVVTAIKNPSFSNVFKF